MMIHLARTVWCATLVTVLAVGSVSQTASEAPPPDFDSVDSYVQYMIDRNDMPGAALLIFDETGPIHQALFDDWPPEKVVPIASASKFLSAAAILRLVDRNVLDLDDPVSKYMPAIEGVPGRITLRQALSMTTGQEPFGRKELADPSYDLAQSAAAILQRDQVYAPGAAFMYGSTHLQIAGRMAEIATGKTWHAIFKDEIADPLNLKCTAFGRFVLKDANVSSPPTFELADIGSARNSNLGRAAQSNAIEYGRFLSMLLNDGKYNGQRILKQETVKAMLSDQTQGAFVAISFWPDKSYRYGFGNWLITRPDTGTTYHASDGAFGTIPWLDRRHGIAGLLMTSDNLFDWIPDSLMLRDLVAATLAVTKPDPLSTTGGD